MTNNQLNRERLEKIKSWRETYGAGSNVMLPAEEAEELACLALAAMDSEPVTVPEHITYISEPTILNILANDDSSPMAYAARLLAYEVRFWRSFPLYRHAQPEPDVVGKLLAILDRHTVELGWGEKPITLAELVIARDGSDELNACRAAMLNGGKS